MRQLLLKQQDPGYYDNNFGLYHGKGRAAAVSKLTGRSSCKVRSWTLDHSKRVGRPSDVFALQVSQAAGEGR